MDGIVKRTMFRHFCGGECLESIQPTLKVHPAHDEAHVVMLSLLTSHAPLDLQLNDCSVMQLHDVSHPMYGHDP